MAHVEGIAAAGGDGRGQVERRADLGLRAHAVSVYMQNNRPINRMERLFYS